MDAVRLGSAVRAVRLRQGWRQRDVAAKAGLSTSVVSRLERGRADELTVRAVFAVTRALDIRLDWRPMWRGGELDRVQNAGHAALHERVAERLTACGWLVWPEASFSVYGERGVIDVLAFHPASASLLVVELKTQLVDVQGMLGAVDRYRRLAPTVASGRGWTAATTSTWVALADTATNRRRLSDHSTVIRAALPHDGRSVEAWLRRPSSTLAALGFISYGRPTTARFGAPGLQRVSRRAARRRGRFDASSPS